MGALDNLFHALRIVGYATAGIVVVLALFLYWIRPKYVSPDVPGPARQWPFGVTFSDASSMLETKDSKKPPPSFDWNTWPTLSLNWSRHFGLCEHGFKTWGGPTINLGFGGAFFNVVNPACLRHIARDNFPNYIKGKLTKSFDELFGSAVFTTDGDEWKFHRKMVVSGLLNRDTVKYAAQLLTKKLNETAAYLEYLEGQVVDIQDVAYKMIFGVFVELAFGVQLKQLEVPPSGKHDTEPEGDISNEKLCEFSKAFDEMQLLVHQRFDDFLWEIKQKFHISQREKDIVRCQKVIDEFAYGVIQKAKKGTVTNEDDSEGKPLHMINRYLKYCRDNNHPEPSDKNLRDMIMTLSLAGRDTTAVSIAWALYELSKHPVWADKIRDEVDSVCGKDEEISFDACTGTKLPIVRAVVAETLRLHSPAPDNFRFAVNDDTLPDGTFIPAGSLVMFSAYTINHSEFTWGENADEFDPSRWIDRGEPSGFEYPVFHAGPRTCPGKNLATMELTMALAFLVSRFDFEDLDSHDGSYKWTLVTTTEKTHFQRNR